jgi:hypothetical protein
LVEHGIGVNWEICSAGGGEIFEDWVQDDAMWEVV